MGHDHAPPGAAEHRGRLAIAFAITTTILIAQAVGALITGSLALLVDTAHMLTDAGGLLLALFAASLSMRPPSERRTWGYRRGEVLAALAQAAVLLAVGGYVLIEGVRRLFDPPEIASNELVVFGIIGLVGNIASMLVLASGRSANFNMRAAFLEVVNDALGSVAVIVAAIVIATTGWALADAVAGLLIGALILPRAFKLLLQTSAVLLESTPAGLDLAAVRQHLLELEHVSEVHDMHASLIATGLPVLSAHVVVDEGCFTTGTPVGSSTSCRNASRPTSTSPSSTPRSRWNPPHIVTTSTPATPEHACRTLNADRRGGLGGQSSPRAGGQSVLHLDTWPIQLGRAVPRSWREAPAPARKRAMTGVRW